MRCWNFSDECEKKRKGVFCCCNGVCALQRNDLNSFLFRVFDVNVVCPCCCCCDDFKICCCVEELFVYCCINTNCENMIFCDVFEKVFRRILFDGHFTELLKCAHCLFVKIRRRCYKCFQFHLIRHFLL